MSGRKSKQRGKSFELAVAKYLGMKRAHFQKHDLYGHDLITVECKKREKLPKSVKDWFAQASEAAEHGKFPILVMGELGAAVYDSLVVLSLEDFGWIIDQALVLQNIQGLE